MSIIGLRSIRSVAFGQVTQVVEHLVAAGAVVSSIIGPVELVGVLRLIQLVSVGQVTLVVEHWVAAGAAVSV